VTRFPFVSSIVSHQYRTKEQVMVPKLDQRRGYASKPRIPPLRPVAINPGNKPVAGPFKRQREGQEFRQITNRERAILLM
jgi:hypothetical protein